MARVPITIMGYRCERCGHEWIPRVDPDEEPRVCPKCRSPYWSKPRKSLMPYDDFKAKVATTLKSESGPMTWTEVRTKAGLPQLFPNNQWVRRMEKDIGLQRTKDSHGIISWDLAGDESETKSSAKTPKPSRSRSS